MGTFLYGCIIYSQEKKIDMKLSTYKLMMNILLVLTLFFSVCPAIFVEKEVIGGIEHTFPDVSYWKYAFIGVSLIFMGIIFQDTLIKNDDRETLLEHSESNS